jgi:hypothetical protein
VEEKRQSSTVQPPLPPEQLPSLIKKKKTEDEAVLRNRDTHAFSVFLDQKMCFERVVVSKQNRERGEKET